MFDKNTVDFLIKLKLDPRKVALKILETGKSLEDILNEKSQVRKYRVSPLENYYIEQEAFKLGYKSVSEYNVKSLIKPSEINVKKCAEMLKETNRIGNNLNQITRNLHIEGTATEELLNELKEIRLQLSMINNTYKDL